MQLLCSIIHGFIFKNIKKKYYSEFIDAISVFINLNHQYNWITKLEAILINPRNKELLSVTHTLSPFFLMNRFIPSKKNILHFFPKTLLRLQENKTHRTKLPFNENILNLKKIKEL